MSLDWDCDDCESPTAADEVEAGARKALVFESMAVCLGRISEENEDEWLFRVMFLQRINLSTIQFASESKSETAAELLKALRRWRGMVTNANHQPDRAQWMQRTMELLGRDVERSLPQLEEVCDG